MKPDPTKAAPTIIPVAAAPLDPLAKRALQIVIEALLAQYAEQRMTQEASDERHG